MTSFTLDTNCLLAVDESRPEEICVTRIRESVMLAESPAFELDVFRHAPGSSGAADYEALVDELVRAGFAA